MIVKAIITTVYSNVSVWRAEMKVAAMKLAISEIRSQVCRSHNDSYCKVSKSHVNTKCKFQHFCVNTALRPRETKLAFFRLMFLSHFGKFARFILSRYSMELFAVWTVAWAMFHLQNGVSSFVNSNYFFQILSVLWKPKLRYVTRDRSVKKRSRNAELVFKYVENRWQHECSTCK